MQKQYLVYWYHLAEHDDVYTQGYVGVTCQNDIRKRCHIAGRSGGSRILSKAYKKYGAENIIQDILYITDDQVYAYAIENHLRPFPEIGWNIAEGGGLPPDTTGRIDPPEVRAKRNASVRKAKAGKSYPSIFKGMTDRHCAERRKAIGDQHRGKTISEAHRKAISEKMSGGDSPKAKEIHLVHRDALQTVHHFPCIKVAAESLGIPYNSLRSQVQRTLKHDRTSDPSHKGWICIAPSDVPNATEAASQAVVNRKARLKRLAQEREAKRRLKGTGVASSINS